MKIVCRILLILISALCASCASTNKKTKPLLMDPDVAEEGALASDGLVQSISLAITKIMGEPDKTIEKFVLQPPAGEDKEKVWRELWIFDSEGSNVQFIITFRENGQGFADFEIRSM